MFIVKTSTIICFHIYHWFSLAERMSTILVINLPVFMCSSYEHMNRCASSEI